MTAFLKNYSGFSPKIVPVSPNSIKGSPKLNYLKCSQNASIICSPKIVSPSLKNNTKHEEVSLKSDKNSNSLSSKIQKRENSEDFEKRSSLDEVYLFIENLLGKSQNEKLHRTEIFMLEGYIDIFIQDVISLSKDNQPFTSEKIRLEWIKLCKVWYYYQAKNNFCEVRYRDIEKLKKLERSFESLEKKVTKHEGKKNNIEEIRKLMKKFEFDILN